MINSNMKAAFFSQIGYDPHAAQELFHNSGARFRIPLCGRRFGKSMMAARDRMPSLFVPNTRGWICGPSYSLGEKEFRHFWDDLIIGKKLGKDPRVKKGYCVDENTEILTERGWLRHDQVAVGDRTLSINPATGLSEWDEIKLINRFPGPHVVVGMNTNNFSARTTLDHRWFVHRRGKGKYTAPGWRWRTTRTLTELDRIPKAVLCAELPTESKYSDEFVELVAWIWTEGAVAPSGSYVVYQSHAVNPTNVARIRRALELVCPNPVRGSKWYPSRYWSERQNGKNTVFDLGVEISNEFRLVFLSHKVVDPRFITSLTAAQLQLFINISVLADGWVRPTQTCIGQKNERQLFAVQLACSLLGIPTSTRYEARADCYVLGILRHVWTNPAESYAQVKSKGVGTASIVYQRYYGSVWCPTTRNGTWLARRDGKVYYTGNSVATGNMYIELPNRSRIEVKSSDHPNSLVGEGLDWLIMSEAAKHGEGIWEKYLRPALSDRRGGADFVTTPEGQNWLYRLWEIGQDPKNHPGNTDPQNTFESWNFPSWANTKIFPGGRNDPEIKAAEATTAPEFFKQEYGAEPTAFAGKIFEDFHPNIHVREVRFNPAWPNYICFDFGWNTFAAIEFQLSPQDEVLVWREYYESGRTLDEHIYAMRYREDPPGYHMDLGFADAADPAGAMHMSNNFVYTLAEPDAKVNWREGVDELASYMQEIETGREVDEFGTPEKKPRFAIDYTCKRLIHEISNYRTPKAPATGADIPDKPFKKNDHGVDALRYGVMHIKLGFATTMDDFVRVNQHLIESTPAKVPELIAMQSSDLSAFEGIYATNTGPDTIFNLENAVF